MQIVARLVAGTSTSAPPDGATGALCPALGNSVAARPAGTQPAVEAIDHPPEVAGDEHAHCYPAVPSLRSPTPEPERRTAEYLHALLLRVVRAADLGLLLPEDANWIRARARATIRFHSPKPTRRKGARDRTMAARKTLTGDTHRPIMPGPLRTACAKDSSGALVVHLAGDIDLGTASTLRAWLTSQLQTSVPYPVLVIDLAAVDFLSCAGLRVLLDVQRRATARGTSLRLARCSPASRRLLDLPDLHIEMQTYPTIEDALP
jgi:anti-sigma B factor antagonist